MRLELLEGLSGTKASWGASQSWKTLASGLEDVAHGPTEPRIHKPGGGPDESMFFGDSSHYLVCTMKRPTLQIANAIL